jgi:hypothetical protein
LGTARARPADGRGGATVRQPAASQISNCSSDLRRTLERKIIPPEIAAASVWFSRRRSDWRKILNHTGNFSRPGEASI